MTSSSKQKTQKVKKLRIIGRKCTKYNFVAPLSFTVTVRVSIKHFRKVFACMFVTNYQCIIRTCPR